MKPHVIVRWGGTGPSDGPADGAAITCEALQITCPIILGFKSSGDIALALERGEVDALYLSTAQAPTTSRLDKLARSRPWRAQRSTLFPDAPSIFEQVRLTPEQEWWLDFRADLNDLGRSPAGYVRGVSFSLRTCRQHARGYKRKRQRSARRARQAISGKDRSEDRNDANGLKPRITAKRRKPCDGADKYAISARVYC
jgi:hypothetical protein